MPTTAQPSSTNGSLRSRKKSEGEPVAERVPPHSEEAEKGVLACILIDGTDENVSQTVKDFQSPIDAFYDHRHRIIIRAVVEMYQRNQTVDMVTVINRLRDSQQLEEAGGETYVMELTGATHSPANLAYYLEIVRNKFVLRRIITVCNNAIRIAFDSPDDAQIALDDVEREILTISQERDVEMKDIEQLVEAQIRQIEEWHGNMGEITGLSTGYRDLDNITFGLQKGEMFVIAARPSMGKTSLAMNIAENVAGSESGCPVGVFSLEMTADSLVLRMLCSRAKVNMHETRVGIFNAEQFASITKSAKDIASWPLFIDDTPGLDILQIKARARQMYKRHDIGLFVIDYLQLLQSRNRRTESRQQEITDISAGIKSLAKELNVPIIVISQLNREVENRQGRPRISDLRESGSIEQDADVVSLLYVPEEEQERIDRGDSRHGVKLLIAKNRNGPVGEVSLIFLKSFTRFEMIAKIRGEDRPGGIQEE